MAGNVAIALVLTALAGLSTTIGSLLGIFVRKPGPRFMALTLGFSAGVMILVSFVELLAGGIEAVGFGLAHVAFFAGMLGTTAFLTGNAIQANTVADTLKTTLSMPVWVTGLVTASIVAMVVIGGITRIGKVTGILAPTMAVIYVTGALTIIGLNYDQVIPTFGLIFREAFNPTASIAGSGAGVFLVTMIWGVKRGLFSNEAGQGSAPIAHAAAKTDEPVSEGVVALVEPFIDTILICTMTGMGSS